MKGDFSRLSFDPTRGFSRVLVQQGRVTLDADVNEQQAINLHLMRTAVSDLIGPYGGPGTGFRLEVVDGEKRPRLMISPGRYYVDGWMCENAAGVAYKAYDSGAKPQPWLVDPPEPGGGSYLAYLEVFERHVSAAEYDRGQPRSSANALREVALDGPDTASRAQVVWQVKLLPLDGQFTFSGPLSDEQWSEVLDVLRPRAKAVMAARAEERAPDGDNPCLVSPQSRFRGIENQLYRVEIVRGGAGGTNGKATFAWSRENGAVIFPIERIAGDRVKLADVWRDARFALGVGDIVEVADAASGLGETGGRLYRVKDYDPDTATVVLDAPSAVQQVDQQRPAVLRRWDHGGRRTAGDGVPAIADDNALELVENRWLTLEEGVSIQFQSKDVATLDLPRVRDADAVAAPALIEKGGVAVKEETVKLRTKAALKETSIREQGGRNREVYRSGDHWLVAARTALGDVLWPTVGEDDHRRAFLPPHGVDRRFAPLALVDIGPDGAPTVKQDLRRVFRPLAEPIAS